MATTEEYKNGGSASYSFSIEKIKDEDIKVSVDGTDLTYTATNPPAQTTEYTVNGSNIIFKQASVSGSATGGVRIYRETALENADSATFVAGSSIRAADLNANHKLIKFAAQEQNQKIVTADIKDSQITSAKILDGTIVDADVNASAAIAGTKIAPDFGSQNITTTGNISTSGTINNLTTTEVAILDGATVNTTELNTLDGITASTAELNILDGVTASTAEINTLDGVTASTAEINTLDGVTASTSEINTLDGITASTAELNILDGATISTTQLNNLQNIEPAAKDDQTAAEIRALVESATDSNVFTDADHTKLNGLGTLNALSDVNTAGVADDKILKYDASVSQFIIADESTGSGGSSTFTGLSDTPTNFGSSAGKVLKVNSGETALEFSDADVVADSSPQLGGNLDVQASEITTSTTDGNIKLAPNGTGKVEIKGNGTNDAQIVLNCGNNSHGQVIKAPPHSAGVSNTFTLPTTDISNLGGGTHFLKTTSAGQVSISSAVHYENGNHINMASGKNIYFGSNNGIIFDSDNSNIYEIYIKGPTTLTKDSNFTLPEDGAQGTFLKTDGSGVLSFGSTMYEYTSGTNSYGWEVGDIIIEGTPDTGQSTSSANVIHWDKSQKTLDIGDGITTKFGFGQIAQKDSASTTNQAVAGNSTIISSTAANCDILISPGIGHLSIGADNVNSEVAKFQPPVNGANQDGYVELKWAHQAGNSGVQRLLTTSTGLSLTGHMIPSADSTYDIGTTSVRWKDIYADTLYGDGSNLTGVNPTVANGCIYENSIEITSDHTTSTTKNSMSAGPITIANNVTLTIPNNSVYTIV
jgi:hypothetical protein